MAGARRSLTVFDRFLIELRLQDGWGVRAMNRRAPGQLVASHRGPAQEARSAVMPTPAMSLVPNPGPRVSMVVTCFRDGSNLTCHPSQLRIDTTSGYYRSTWTVNDPRLLTQPSSYGQLRL
jgi:hypothetical protein